MKTAMIFPGYSSQFVGMGKDLYDKHRLVQEYFEEASNCLNANMVKLCFASSDAELSKMSNAYTALFLVSGAIAKLLMHYGVKPDVVSGYNQGEYAALFAAGAINFPDGLYQLNKYTLFYQEALATMHVGAMSIRNMSTDTVEKIVAKARKKGSEVAIAIYQDTLVHIVTGHAQAMERFADIAAQFDDAKLKDVGIEVGLHSSLLDEVAAQCQVYLQKVDCKDLVIPYISGTTGVIIQTADQVKAQVIDNINHPVRWTQVMTVLADYDLIIEVGPGTVLSDILKKHYPDKKIIAINKQTDIEELQKMIEPTELHNG
jgi:[acyl-carrier-protein] S-malonyltransferase